MLTLDTPLLYGENASNDDVLESLHFSPNLLCIDNKVYHLHREQQLDKMEVPSPIWPMEEKLTLT